MKIKLEDDYILNGDAYNYWVSKIVRPEDEAKKPYERICSGYYRTVEEVFADVLERRIRESDAESIKDLIKHINKAKRSVAKAAKGLNEQLGKRGGN